LDKNEAIKHIIITLHYYQIKEKNKNEEMHGIKEYKHRYTNVNITTHINQNTDHKETKSILSSIITYSKLLLKLST
jgi:hypothetical protein